MLGFQGFHSLRGRLIASYAFVIFLSLFLAGSAFIYLLRNYQTQLKLNQLANLVVPTAAQVWTLDRQGATLTQIDDLLHEQAAELKVRILLIDPQHKVVVDTGDSLADQELRLPDNQNPRLRIGVLSGTVSVQNGQQAYVLWLPPRPRPRAPGTERLPATRVSQLSVVLAVQPEDVTTAWLELAPNLAGAALVSLIISTVVALFISRTITGPINQMTTATREMAKGNYDYRIPTIGIDEVGRLAATFNSMAQDVGDSHRLLRDFLANVSHDLRTPLTSIQGFSQAMLDGAIQTPQEYSNAAEIINDESARMRRLVEDLLYLSKIESGQAIMERRTLDLSDLLRACSRRFDWLAEQKDVDVQLDVPTGAEVEGDEHYLEQVFANLLDNALRHTPASGSVRIRAWLGQPPAVDGWAPGAPRLATDHVAYVAVYNSGSTIPAQDLPRVFERFYQVDKSRSKPASSSGLGLAIVREIVQAHGGAVAARSQAGDGTEFLVALPVSRPGNGKGAGMSGGPAA